MARTYSYVDAVKLLGGEHSAIVAALDRVAGGLLLGAAPALPVLLGWFDAKAEFVRLGHDLVRAVAERRSGLSRFSRTQRLEAAHAVIVVTAFFDAMAAAELPFRYADIKLTRAEQDAMVRTAAGVAWHGGQRMAGTVLGSAVPLPRPHEPQEAFEERLARFYSDVSAAVLSFVEGLHLADSMGETDLGRCAEILAYLPVRAGERYAELARQLAADFPEVEWWMGLREHQATRAEVRGVGTALDGMRRMLADISTGRAPDERRAALARAYRARLDRAVVLTGDAPPGVRIPTLAEAYVEPLFRIAEVTPEVRASEESWWSGRRLRDDLEEFITGYLTSPGATGAPLLVLGQPGSGKSVFTMILAARLPAEDFLPVRVELREVPAEADLQDQIEYALRAATGERLEWPALVRSAGDALPVVLLDGFDELLQATGVSQTDYLMKIARFQRREADQGRPLAVLVTSRTSVADRARPPEGAVALRLEPFDESRVRAWVRIWNAANAGHLAERALRPLRPEAVLAHPSLAEQPLLLLMLALYDSECNALQQVSGARAGQRLGQAELYGQLLRDFSAREVDKHHPDLNDRDRRLAVEEELRRLSVVAFAMFNRGAQWITEADLEVDLSVLFGPAPGAVRRNLPAAGRRELPGGGQWAQPGGGARELRGGDQWAQPGGGGRELPGGDQWAQPGGGGRELRGGDQWAQPGGGRRDLAGGGRWDLAGTGRQDLRGALGAAEITLGRFFFIHRSQASRGATRLHTYEFLHATFGEFLVARFTWLVLREMAAREAASTFLRNAAPVDDDLLHALLSFAPVSSRAPVIGFLRELAAGLPGDQRDALSGLLTELFREVYEPRPARGYDGYQPRRLGVPARYAAYSANLLLLAVCVAGELRGRDLYGPDADRVGAWHSQALLWRSQLSSEDWTSVVDVLALDRVWDGDTRDIVLRLDDGDFTPPPIDPDWVYDDGGRDDGRPGQPPRQQPLRIRSEHQARVLRRKGNFQCGHLDDVVLHAVEPLLEDLDGAINTFITQDGRSETENGMATAQDGRSVAQDGRATAQDGRSITPESLGTHSVAHLFLRVCLRSLRATTDEEWRYVLDLAWHLLTINSENEVMNRHVWALLDWLVRNADQVPVKIDKVARHDGEYVHLTADVMARLITLRDRLRSAAEAPSEGRQPCPGGEARSAGGGSGGPGGDGYRTIAG